MKRIDLFILYTITDNFAPQLSASIISVCENNREAPSIHFYILGQGIKAQTEEKLQRIVGSYQRTMEIIQIDGFEDVFDNFDTTGWNKIVLSRLLIACFLPESVTRVLYLDADTIVIRPLEKLWATDFSDNEILGAVIEPTVDRKRLSSLGLESKPYVNAGVLLIDLESWRRERAEEIILDYFAEHRSELFANDQDAINGALQGRIKLLPPCYNWCNSYVFYPYRAIKKMMGSIPYYTEEEFKGYVSNPTIVHFLGEERPWRIGNTHVYRDEYIRYLSMGPYAGEGMEEGWKGYFRAWTAFNTLTKPFPMLRWRTITGLIPSVMRIRSKKQKKQAT